MYIYFTSIFTNKKTPETPPFLNIPAFSGVFLYGPDGTRTHALCVANAALSQLSYEPFSITDYIIPHFPGNYNQFFQFPLKISAKNSAENFCKKHPRRFPGRSVLLFIFRFSVNHGIPRQKPFCLTPCLQPHQRPFKR